MVRLPWAFVRKGVATRPAARGGCAGVRPPSAPARFGLLARSSCPAAAWMEFGGPHGRRAALQARRRPGWGVAGHGVVHEDARPRGTGRRLPPGARGSPSRWTARTSRSRCWQPPRGWFGLGGPPTAPGHDASRAGPGGSVCVLCGVSETGDFRELPTAPRTGGVALVAPRRLPAARSVATDGRRSYAGSLGGSPTRCAPAASWRW